MKPVRVAIFASGTGSNAMALIQKSRSLKGLEIGFVLSDKTTAPVLAKAQASGVRTYLVEKKTDRAAHEHQVLGLLKEHHIDWVLLAGYMRLLSSDFLKTFSAWHGGASQVVNIHPSLLPAYPGVDSIARAFNDGVSESGVTLHLVDEGMDTGTVLNQGALPLMAGETLDRWALKIHDLEHRMYTEFLESLALKQRSTSYFEET
ncbi:Phosphoribosylglycinamide formyltransferase [compost metagenome]